MTHVDNHRSFLDHIGGDEFGLADGYDQDIGGATQFGQIFSAAVSNGYGGITGIGIARHQYRHRCSHVIAAAKHDTVLAFSLDLVAPQQFHDAIGRR